MTPTHAEIEKAARTVAGFMGWRFRPASLFGVSQRDIFVTADGTCMFVDDMNAAALWERKIADGPNMMMERYVSELVKTAPGVASYGYRLLTATPLERLMAAARTVEGMKKP